MQMGHLNVRVEVAYAVRKAQVELSGNAEEADLISG